MPTPRKSLAEHTLNGTKPHFDVTSPHVLEAGRPRYPKGITLEAKRVFKDLCKLLGARRALTEGDRFLLHLFAETWDRRARAQENLLAQGEICTYTRLDPNGVAHEIEKPNLNLKVLEAADKTLISILDRLGLTPLSASKVKPTSTEVVAKPKPGTLWAEHPEWFSRDGKTFIGGKDLEKNVQ